MFSRVEGMIYV